MRYFYSLLFILGVFAACSSGKNSADAGSEPGYYGKTITADKAVKSTEIHSLLKGDSVDLKVQGEIIQCCQVKGCWMTMDVGAGKDMRVKFRDYGFFVPKDCTGKEAVIEGTAYKQVVSMEELKHLAEDEGKSEEEINKITGPQEQWVFIADGVIIL